MTGFDHDAKTVSIGTLHRHDLIPAFLNELRLRDDVAYAQFVAAPFSTPPAYALEDRDSEWWDSDEAVYVLDDLVALLDDAAPEGYYFGTIEGDGACFGFWPIDDTE